MSQLHPIDEIQVALKCTRCSVICTLSCFLSLPCLFPSFRSLAPAFPSSSFKCLPSFLLSAFCFFFVPLFVRISQGSTASTPQGDPISPCLKFTALSNRANLLPGRKKPYFKLLHIRGAGWGRSRSSWLQPEKTQDNNTPFVLRQWEGGRR